jgi:hypothetical protein
MRFNRFQEAPMAYPLALRKAEAADGPSIGISGGPAFIAGPSLPGLA